MDNKKLSDLFNKFVGKEVSGKEEIQDMCGFKSFVYTPDKNDPVLAEMNKTAQDNNLRLRVSFPGFLARTTDYDLNRVNAHVDRAPDGKYRIGNNFSVG